MHFKDAEKVLAYLNQVPGITFAMGYLSFSEEFTCKLVSLGCSCTSSALASQSSA